MKDYKINQKYMGVVFLLGRLIFGGFFMFNGLNHFTKKKSLSEYAKSKHITSPELAIALSGALIFVCGICIIFGIFVDIALLGIALFLFITSFTIHAFWKDTDPITRMNNQVNFMKNMALLGASLMMLSIEYWPLTF